MARTLARTIGQQLSQQISQPVTVDNKPGGNTAIAASEVARSAADGYTILSADNGTMVFNTACTPNSPTTRKDLTPVTLMGRFPMILVVGPNSDVKDAKDFVAKAKAAPGKISYGSAGAGSPHHLAMELLRCRRSAHGAHPYRGAAPALTDLAGGQVAAMMVESGCWRRLHQGWQGAPAGGGQPTRLPQLPDVPTFAELGLGRGSLGPGGHRRPCQHASRHRRCPAKSRWPRPSSNRHSPKAD